MKLLISVLLLSVGLSQVTLTNEEAINIANNIKELQIQVDSLIVIDSLKTIEVYLLNEKIQLLEDENKLLEKKTEFEQKLQNIKTKLKSHHEEKMELINRTTQALKSDINSLRNENSKLKTQLKEAEKKLSVAREQSIKKPKAIIENTWLDDIDKQLNQLAERKAMARKAS